MVERKVPGFLIVGNDTGVGKTFVAAGIARCLRQQGRRVGVYKPVASGCADGPLEATDGWLLWDAAGRPESLDVVSPQTFAAPLAPHLAARAEGREVDWSRILQGSEVWQDYDIVLVEGAGGLMSPLTDDHYVADLAWALRLPLLVVAANRLGVINLTLQTLIAAAAFEDGLPLAGVILNDVAPQLQDASCSTNPAELAVRCVPPILAHVRWNDPSTLHAPDWFALAQSFQSSEPDE